MIISLVVITLPRQNVGKLIYVTIKRPVYFPQYKTLMLLSLPITSKSQKNISSEKKLTLSGVDGLELRYNF